MRDQNESCGGEITPAAGAPLLVLLVDDQPIIAEAIRLALRGEPGLELHYCSKGEEALETAARIRPMVILQDLVMPGVDGIGLVRSYRNQPVTADVPVIVLSSREEPETKKRAFEAGASDYLVKLPDAIELSARISAHGRAFLHRRQRDEAYRALSESQQELSRLNVELVAANRKLEESTRRAHELSGDLATQNEKLEAIVAERTAALQAAMAELRAAQDRIVHQERVNAFGVMASGVAHDFNNVLSITMGFAELLLLDHEQHKPADRREFLETILTAARDGARMVNRLREFHREPEEEIWEKVDLGLIVEQAVQITRPRWLAQAQSEGACIQVSTELEPVPCVRGQAAELRELVTNLVFNAVDAVVSAKTGRGTITLRAKTDGDHVLLEVADSGIGMSEEVRDRCLEPFFTTKGEYGTGMGLAMVYGIAERHGARLEVESQPGQGTLFRFAFPRETDAPDAVAGKALKTARPLRVLLVDDQPFICDIVMQYLRQDCHEADAVADPEDALERLAAEHFDVLITDQAMPGMTGGELAVRTKAVSPSTCIVLLTGFGAEERPEPGAEAIHLVLGKPVTQDTLRRALAKCTQFDF